jgi:hypothetical protein
VNEGSEGSVLAIDQSCRESVLLHLGAHMSFHNRRASSGGRVATYYICTDALLQEALGAAAEIVFELHVQSRSGFGGFPDFGGISDNVLGRFAFVWRSVGVAASKEPRGR